MRLFFALQTMEGWLRLNGVFLRLLLLMLSVILATTVVHASDSSREWTIKAAYLFRLSLFVDWPEDKLKPASSDDVRFCITGERQGIETIKSVLAGKSINQHAIEIVGVTPQSELTACHVLYVSKGTQEEAQFLRAVADAPVLTIGNSDEFYRQGGIVLLFERDNRIHFAVNVKQLGLSGVRLRAQLLNLAEHYP